MVIPDEPTGDPREVLLHNLRRCAQNHAELQSFHLLHRHLIDL